MLIEKAQEQLEKGLLDNVVMQLKRKIPRNLRLKDKMYTE